MKVLMTVLITFLCYQLNAQDVVGDWNGKLSFQGTELRIVFHITSQDGDYKGTMDSPDQGASGIPIETVMYEKGKLTIRSSELLMEYIATLDPDGETLNGTFNQSGVTIPLEMTK